MQPAPSPVLGDGAPVLVEDDAAIRPAEAGKILIIDKDRHIGDIVSIGS